jgi:hypothetical protein
MFFSIRQIVRRQSVCLAVLLGLAALLGMYHILQTVVIAEDGVLYIQWAQSLPAGYRDLCKRLPPGFPVLLWAAHNVAFFFTGDSSNTSWIYSSQAVVLFTQLGSLFFLWKIGCRLFRPLWVFGGLLILLFLPVSKHGCDVLRDWPHLLFLSAAFYSILRNLKKQSPFGWMLGAFLGGVGYLFRPESAQILLYLAVLLGLLFWKQKTPANAGRVLLTALLIAAAWLLPVLPYWLYADSVIPPKLLLSSLGRRASLGVVLASAEAVRNLPAAWLDFFKNLTENLLYYFLPFWLLGLWRFCRKKLQRNNFPFSIMNGFLLVNTAILLLLSICYGYVAKRHFLLLLSISCPLIVSGMQTGAVLLPQNVKELRTVRPSVILAVSFAFGIAIALPKTLQPLHPDKIPYRHAADWLRQHTPPNALVASPDRRIPFYAGRPAASSSKTADYVIRIYSLHNPPPAQARYISVQKWPFRKTVVEIFVVRKGNSLTCPDR